VYFEGPRVISPTVPAAAGRRVNALLARDSGDRTYEGMSVLFTSDGGATFNTVPGGGFDSNAVKFPNATLSAAPNIQALTGVDSTTTITVVVDSQTKLTSIPLSNIYDPVNTFYLPSYGLARFATATLTAANTYVLSNILWNIQDSTEFLARRYRTQPTIQNFYLLEGEIVQIGVSNGNSVNVTNNLNLITEFNGVQSNFNPTFATNPDSDNTFNDLNRDPRPVRNVVSTPSGLDRILTWDPGGDPNVYDPDPFTSTPFVTTDKYQIYIVDPTVNANVVLATIFVTGQTHTLTSAFLATLPGTPTNFKVAIVEERSATVVGPQRLDFAFQWPI
jgi:hypothetical protein